MHFLGFSSQISPEECLIVQLVVVPSMQHLRSVVLSRFGSVLHFELRRASASCFLCFLHCISPEDVFIVQSFGFSTPRFP